MNTRFFNSLLAFALLVLAAGCGNQSSSPAFNDPNYIKGLKLKEAGEYQNAETQLLTCFRRHPYSFRTAFQLATLYSDHLNDPFHAAYFFRKCIETESLAPRTETESAVIRSGLEKAERQLIEALSDIYPKQTFESVKHLYLKEQENRDIQKKRITEKEKSLGVKIIRLSRANAHLQSELNESRNDILKLRSELEKAQMGNPPPGLSEVQEYDYYTVQKGDTLSKVSQKEYGSIKYWKQLKEINKEVLKGGDIIHPGMNLKTPPLKELQYMKNQSGKNEKSE